MSAVARRAGVGVASLYSRYRSKEELIRQLSIGGMQSITDQARAALSQSDARSLRCGPRTSSLAGPCTCWPWGSFVLLASRIPGVGQTVHMFAYVAAVPALVSVVSVVWFNGSVFILLGRLLCMIWIVIAAVRVNRHLSRDAEG